MDVSSLSKMLHGERGMLVSEAQQLADLLEVDIADVIRNASAKPK